MGSFGLPAFAALTEQFRHPRRGAALGVSPSNSISEAPGALRPWSPLGHGRPNPERVSVWPAIGSVLLICGVTALAHRMVKSAPYLAFGWLWFLGTLVPVIGLVQVGAQATADRYTYVPLIGVFIAIAWGLA